MLQARTHVVRCRDTICLTGSSSEHAPDRLLQHPEVTTATAASGPSACWSAPLLAILSRCVLTVSPVTAVSSLLLLLSPLLFFAAWLRVHKLCHQLPLLLGPQGPALWVPPHTPYCTNKCSRCHTAISAERVTNYDCVYVHTASRCRLGCTVPKLPVLAALAAPLRHRCTHICTALCRQELSQARQL